jgi:hypothetical protein
MNEALEKTINEFLADRRKSESGGWAQIEPKDVDGLYKIIGLLIEEKCEPDSDGDYPFDYSITNRRIYEPAPYLCPVPYMHQAQTDEERIDIISTLFSNMRSIGGRLNAAFDVYDYYRHQSRAKKGPLGGLVKE